MVIMFPHFQFFLVLVVGLFCSKALGSCQPTYPLTVAHTSASSSTGTVTAKSTYSSSYPAWRAFDDSYSFWISGVFDSPTWISYAFTRTVTVSGYRFFFKNGSLTSRAPKQFDLQVKEGSTWKTVDSRCCEINWSGSEERTFQLHSGVSGTEFRFMFYDDNDSRSGVVVISLARIQFLGV